MVITRLVKEEDLAELIKLANSVDGFMTTMPNDEAGMKQRIATAIASISKEVIKPKDEIYLFVLEEGGEIVGISAIYSTVGIDRPFYSYRVTEFSNVSPDIGIRNDINILNLVNDYNGCSELATLFLHPEKRGGGRGVLLSFTRLMFMAAHRHRFPRKAMAEIRGWTDENGTSPFWEAVGKKFFNMEMADADSRSGGEFQFMADLMPKFPIYTDLLPQGAQDVIAKPNETAKGAVKLLSKQGFRYQGLVDIFDAGICLDTWIDDIDVIRNIKSVKLVQADQVEDEQRYALIANPNLEQFCVVNQSTSYADANENSIYVSTQVIKDLNLKVDESALLYWL